MWIAMTLVMMVPTVLRPMARVSRGSSRRATMFLLGYVACWLIAGVPAFLATSLAMTSMTALLSCWGLVGLWQMLPSTASMLRKCQGLRAESGSLALGLRQGSWCVSSCWLLMVAAMASIDRFALPLAAGVAVMAVVAGFIMWQKSPKTTGRTIQMAGVAVVVAVTLLYATGLGSGGPAHDMATKSL